MQRLRDDEMIIAQKAGGGLESAGLGSRDGSMPDIAKFFLLDWV